MPKFDYERLIKSISILEVARRLGMNLVDEKANSAMSLCPFHDDSRPSLFLDANRDQSREHFHCFACGAHGDAIDLVKKQLDIGFIQAVDWLSPGAKKDASGLKSSVSNKYPASKDAISATGINLGYSQYKKSSDLEAFSRWADSRNLDIATLERAGFVHAKKNQLSRILKQYRNKSKQREDADCLEEAHLIRRTFPGFSENRSMHLDMGFDYRDFFIGDRIIFPILDEKKKLVGLGGRSVEDETDHQSPKYQFTRGFPKASILYRSDFAFNQLKASAKKGQKNLTIYICEGFFDALRFEAMGMPAVAIMGSTISSSQVQLLRDLNESIPKKSELRVVISFDRDEAGLRGAEDAALKMMSSKQGSVPINCKFLWPSDSQLSQINCNLKRAKDPNDYLQHLNPEFAQKWLDGATYPPEFAVLANAFSVSADELLDGPTWQKASRSRRYRAFARASRQLRKVIGRSSQLFTEDHLSNEAYQGVRALADFVYFVRESESTSSQALASEDFLNSAEARLNHSRILAYMGSRRGELPCDEPRWERLVSRLGNPFIYYQ